MNLTRLIWPSVLLGVGVAIGFVLSPEEPGSGSTTPLAAAEPGTGFFDQNEQRDPAAKADEKSPTLSRGPHRFDSIMETASLKGDFAQTEALYNMAGRADKVTLERYIDEAVGIEIDAERSAALQILFLRYSELDPEGSLNHLFSLNLDQRINILYVMFNGWAKFDLDDAIDRSALVDDGTEQSIVHRAIVEAYENQPEVMLDIAGRLKGETAAQTSAAVRALARAARSRPREAARTAMTMPSERDRQEAIRAIGEIWAQQDPDEALAYGSQIENASVRRQFRLSVLSRMIRDMPERGFALLDGGNSQEQQMILTMAVGTLVQIDPHRAIAMAAALEPETLRENALSNVISNWSGVDVLSAAQALENLSSLTREQKRNVAWGISHQLAQLSPQEALSWAERMEGEKGDLWMNTLNNVAGQDPEVALGLALTLDPSPKRIEMLTSILGSIASRDPVLAADYLNEIPDGDMKNQAVSNIASQWAQNDPVAALEWVFEQGPGSENYALPSIAYQIAATDLDLLVSYTDRVSGPARDGWLDAIAGRYAQNDPEAGGRWVMQHSDSRQFSAMVGHIAGGLVRKNPRAAIRMLDHVSGTQPYAMAQQILIDRWAEVDAKAAARWWTRLPAEKQMPSAIQTLVHQWSRYDRNAARNWVLNLKMSSHRDNGIQALIRYDTEIFEAEDLIRKIQSLDLRLQSYQSLLANVARYDINAAQDVVRKARLPEDLRSQLHQMVDDYDRAFTPNHR